MANNDLMLEKYFASLRRTVKKLAERRNIGLGRACAILDGCGHTALIGAPYDGDWWQP